MAKVSVILTSFNHAKYICEAIDSIINQTFTDFELIILDDASSDNSWDLIKQYFDPRIKAFQSEGQGEVTQRLNNAIYELATGEYIAIHHSDDVWELDKLEKQVDFLDTNQDVGAVFTWGQIIDEHGVESTADWFYQENKTRWQWLNQLFLERNQLCQPSVLIRKLCYQNVGVYRLSLFQTPDAELWSRVLIEFPIHVIQEKLTKHRKFSDKSNVSGDRFDSVIRANNEWNVLRKNYLSITNFEDIVATFPSLERFRNPEGFDNKFLLAMACLYECSQRSAWQLGLTWLFELIDDKTRYEKIKKLYSFSHLDFLRLTAEFDVYELHSLAELGGQVTNLNQTISDLNQTISERDEQINAYKLQAEQFDVQLRAASTQIINLNQALQQRDEQIANLKLNPDVAEAGFDPAMHYLLDGCRDGRAYTLPEMDISGEHSKLPEDFDQDLYHKLYPDVAAAGLDPIIHYLLHGHREGRICSLPEIELCGDYDFKPDRETILVVSHEASRTGAPMLCFNLTQELAGRYNVVALLLGGGPLADAFKLVGAAVIESFYLRGNLLQADMVVGSICKRFDFKFALVNSIESRIVLPALSKCFVPSISLIHEFSSCYSRPQEVLSEACFWSDKVIFSANITLDNAVTEYPLLGELSVSVLPQGRCIIPLDVLDEEKLQAEGERISRLIRPDNIAKDSLIVLGAGSVQYRKGVDLFIECAALVLRLLEVGKCRFVWIGGGYDPYNDAGYSVYLADQIRRAGLQEHVFFIDETPAIETAYREADLLLLSSRLDPLPNVAIDAMAHGMPVLCYDKTTGIADFLIENGLQDHCVAQYLDSADMAKKIVDLASSQALRKDVAERCHAASIAYFNMDKYIASLEILAQDACHRMEQERKDTDTIINSGLFRQDFSCPSYQQGESIKDAVRFYVREWATGIGRRKPFPGFHPGIYLKQHGIAIQGADPFADYLRAGLPEGPWNYPVILEKQEVGEDLPGNHRVALHLHIGCPELLPEIITRLACNRICPDLFVSIIDENDRQLIISQLKDYKGRLVDIQLVPNWGRDIGPFLTAFGQSILANYDFVGHIHTKKTVDVKNALMGESWRRFLLGNLLGCESRSMADTILARMNEDASIGIVFPDDPNIEGWGSNLAFAEPLAARVGLKTLPENFIFPVGTMFWAKASALAPLLNLNLGWDDYPEDPIPSDGSSLHALESLFPLTLSMDNLRSVTTNVTGLTR